MNAHSEMPINKNTANEVIDIAPTLHFYLKQ